MVNKVLCVLQKITFYTGKQLFQNQTQNFIQHHDRLNCAAL